jgi:hypothetical protein
MGDARPEGRAYRRLERPAHNGWAMVPKTPLLLGLFLALTVADGSAQTSTPVWAKPDQFWYRKTVPGGNLWLKVDAQHGVREPLFDHQRLAIELTIRTGVEYTPLTLPFADPAAQFVVKYDGSNAYIQEGAMAIEFVHGGQHWRCDLQIKWDWNRVPPTDYECLPRRPVAPDATAAARSGGADDRPRVSPDGRWEASIERHNVALRPAGTTRTEPVMLSSDGTAEQPYLPGSIHWASDSRTISAYRVSPGVWISDSVAGTVKSQVAKGSWIVTPHR